MIRPNGHVVIAGLIMRGIVAATATDTSIANSLFLRKYKFRAGNGG